MPPKSRQAAQKQKGAPNASGTGSQVPGKSKSALQEYSTESNPAQWPDANAFLPPTLASLRRDWRWAAVSQFLYTFQGPLRLDPYIEVELEEDLAYGSDIALSKIVHRLLFTLAQDRKITPQNWMGYLQGQYARRYSPRPNPFLQDMLPPSHFPEEEKETEANESGDDNEKIPKEASDSEAPGEPIDEKPNCTSIPENNVDSDTKPVPDGVIPHSEAANSLEANDSGPVTAPLPEPVVKIQPMRQWSDLSQSEQLDVLWTLCEWQFTGAMRLRTLLGDDDSGVGWRMEPVGWDSKKNTYWLVGETRLWIQHHVSQPPRPTKKRGRAPQVVALPAQPTITSRERPRFSDDEADDEGAHKTQPEDVDEEEPETVPEATSSRSLTPPPAQSKRSSTRQSRSSSTTGKKRANEGANGSRKRAKVTGTRVSLRLRGSNKKEADEDGWQSVPDEWLDKGDESKQSPKAADPFGSDSDLTEVEELEREIELERKKREEPEGGQRKSGRTRRKGKDNGSEALKVPEPEPEPDTEPVEEALAADDSQSKQLPTRLHVAPLVDPMLPPPLPPGFIEWETVCASLQDWEAFPARFEKATHPNEKSFRSYLNKVLVPAVTTALKAQLKVKKLESAVQNRKRSSRLAIKESIVEAQRQEESRRAAELELHARARRQEERERRQQEEMLKRERDREEKLRSREVRAGRRAGWDGSESGSASPAPPEALEPPVKIRLKTGRIASTTPTSSPVETPISSTPSSAPGSGTTSREDESWELLCEGCGKQGWNTDDGYQLVKCESCGRWSHTSCHDRADEFAGNAKRDWSSVEFTCRACSNNARKTGANGTSTLTKMSNGVVPPATVSSAPPVNGVPVGVSPVQMAPAPAVYMYGTFQAAPNGNTTPNQPIYPPPPHMLPQQAYTSLGQPRAIQPTPTAYVPYPPTQPVPIPQFQTPVPPLSQPPPMYPPAYLNGHSGP